MPVTGPGKGGRVGASATQHVVQNLVRDTTRDEDVSAFRFCSFDLDSFFLFLVRVCFGMMRREGAISFRVGEGITYRRASVGRARRWKVP